MIPARMRPLFWDVNPDDFDPAAYPRYTVERVLERGEEADVAWLLQQFTREQIRDVLRTDRRLSARSAHFWALVFELPVGEVAALRTDS